MRFLRAGVITVVVGLASPWAAAVTAHAEDGFLDDPFAVEADRTSGKADGRSQDRSGKGDRRAKDRTGTKDGREKGTSPQPGDARRASVVKTGWWWIANEPPPETGVLAAPQPPSPQVPAGGLAVGAAGGDPEKVAAVEVSLRAKEGSDAKRLAMVLRETDQPGSNLGAETAQIMACPVTELFWANGEAASWKNRPTYDCEAGGVAGKRSEDGLWRFDLTGLADAWLTEGSTASKSVVLVEAAEAPSSFQVVLDGAKAEGIGLELAATPPAPEDDDGDLGGDLGGDPGDGDVGGGSGGGGLGSGGSSGGGSLGGSPEVPMAGGDEPVGDGAAVDSSDDGAAAQVAPVAGPPAWYSGISRTGYLLVPLVLGLAYLIMLALGPDGRPLPTTGRHGVSRALDRLRQAGRDLRSAR